MTATLRTQPIDAPARPTAASRRNAAACNEGGEEEPVLLAAALRNWGCAATGASEEGRRFADDMAEAAATLCARFMKFDAAAPGWPDRDRLLFSGPPDPLLPGLLSLMGQPGPSALAAGESGARGEWWISAPASGPAAVGMALAERMLAARFGKSLIDHRVWVLGCRSHFEDGMSHEALGLAGQLRLDRLCMLLRDPPPADHPGIETATGLLRRAAALGWGVKQVAASTPAAIAAALSWAVRTRKPTLILCTTAPRLRQESAAPTPEAAAAMAAAGPQDHALAMPGWEAIGRRGAVARRAWLKRFRRHPLRPELDRVLVGRLPEAWSAALATARALFATAAKPRLVEAGQHIMGALGAAIPELVGGPASTGAVAPTEERVVGAERHGARRIFWGARRQACTAAMAGMALHGGLLPYASISLADSEVTRSGLRLAAALRQRLILVVEEPSDAGADTGAEQLALLRATPNLAVFRPCDAIEAAECWDAALRRAHGPSVLCLSHAATTPVCRDEWSGNRALRGGYLLAEAPCPPRKVTLIATGPEVTLALATRQLLAEEGIGAAVVSLPCWELFGIQDAEYRAAVLGRAPRVGIEAASGFGWQHWLGPDGLFLGADKALRRPGAPLTAELVASRIRHHLADAVREAADRGPP